jgi:tRNA A-37 threonylcarbamoyl transferase component Bud32
MIGRTIGNYVVREKIGEGGMGVVYRAEHPHINRHVAIKVLHPGADRNPEVVHRFFNEARAATEIRNAHIVEVMDFGELKPEGTPYLVMEWLEGESLGGLLRASRKLPVARAAHIMSGIARALKAAHSKGVVHRDLKPDNVFLVRIEGEPDLIKVLDFGIAKLLVTAMPARYQTQTGAIIGTPAYMSPEQCRGAKEIDHRTDLYSLGVMGYQMLTGRLPFEAEALGELLLKHMTEKPPPPAALDASVPAAISDVIAGALEKEPERRPTVDEIIAVMEGGGTINPLLVTAGRAGGTVALPTSGPGVASGSARAAAGSHTTLGASASEMGTGRAPGSGRRIRLVAAVAGVAVVGALALVLGNRRPVSPATPPLREAASRPTLPAERAPIPATGTAAPATPAAPRASAVVGIAVRTEPEAARLEIDGQPVSNPFAKTVDRDQRAHNITASLPGFTSALETVSFDRDRELLLKLARVPGKGSPSGEEAAGPRGGGAAGPKSRGGGRSRGDARSGPSLPDSPQGKAAGYRGSRLNIETEFPGSN